MKSTIFNNLALAAALFGALSLSGCSDSTEPEIPDSDPGSETPASYPEVPKPSGPDDFDGPDQSDAFTLIEPLAGKDMDFSPTWSAGNFTWDVDIQTQYEEFNGAWYWTGDPEGNYWTGTRHTSQMRFEGGVVDLRNPVPLKGEYIHEPTYTYDPIPRCLVFMENGTIVDEPFNPKIKPSDFHFQFYPIDGTPDVRFDPGIFVGYRTLEVENGFLQRNKRRAYYVAITQAPKLTNPVYMMRERFWERVLVDGTKSVRVDEGASKSVTYTSTTGTAYGYSWEFVESTNVTAQIMPFDVGASLEHTLSEAYGESVEVTEEVSESKEYTVTGLTGKTVIFSVWESVERYSFVDAEGKPYTDPNYTFSDLGTTAIRGDHEVLQSAIFDAQ